MKLCVTCQVRAAAAKRRECGSCIAKRHRANRDRPIATAKQGPPQIDTGDLFLNELIGALIKLDESTLPIIGEGMTV
jgi:hypothetical protein